MKIDTENLRGEIEAVRGVLSDSFANALFKVTREYDDQVKELERYRWRTLKEKPAISGFYPAWVHTDRWKHDNYYLQDVYYDVESGCWQLDCDEQLYYWTFPLPQPPQDAAND